jgi:hypothetical protein
MSEFGKALNENKGNLGEGLEYYYKFINQYIKIPETISRKIDTDFTSTTIGVRYCICLILTNLVKYGVVSYSRDNNYYAEHGTKYYTRENMIHAVDLLNHKYLISRTGSKKKEYYTGISSRLHPLDKIYELDSNFIEKLDFKSIPLIQINNEKIYNKWDLKKVVSNSTVNNNYNTNIHSLHTPLHSNNTPHYQNDYTQIFQEARILNRKYWNRMTLDFSQLTNLSFIPLNQVCLTRIFNKNECGRWYQKDGLSYQHLSKDERIKILLNGQEVQELDYSAMHPNLLYVWEGQQCPIDFYEQIALQLGIPYNKDTKLPIKLVTLMSINAPNEKELAKAIKYDRYTERKANSTRLKEGRDERPILLDELERLNIDFKQIVEAFKQAHSVIAKYIYSASANKLMLNESHIMTNILLDLMKRKIPAIPIHDSVVFYKKHANIVRKVMLDTYTDYTRFTINVK